MKKRILAAVLCIMVIFSMMPAMAAAADRELDFAEMLAGDLKELGLFQGVSESNFDLGRAPTRVEAVVMLIRVLGEEDVALSTNRTHPFKDVPGWADNYVGYAFQQGLTKGISASEFGTGDANAQMYLTFVLRALGYSDTAGTENAAVDFSWKDPYTLAKSLGLLPDYVNTDSFLRADVAIVSYAALAANCKGKDFTLAQRLMNAGVFTSAQYNASYDAAAIGNYAKTLAEASAAAPGSVPAASSGDISAVPYYGDRSLCKMSAEQAAAYAKLLTYGKQGLIPLYLSDSGDIYELYPVQSYCTDAFLPWDNMWQGERNMSMGYAVLCDFAGDGNPYLLLTQGTLTGLFDDSPYFALFGWQNGAVRRITQFCEKNPYNTIELLGNGLLNSGRPSADEPSDSYFKFTDGGLDFSNKQGVDTDTDALYAAVRTSCRLDDMAAKLTQYCASMGVAASSLTQKQQEAAAMLEAIKGVDDLTYARLIDMDGNGTQELVLGYQGHESFASIYQASGGKLIAKTDLGGGLTDNIKLAQNKITKAYCVETNVNTDVIGYSFHYVDRTESLSYESTAASEGIAVPHLLNGSPVSEADFNAAINNYMRIETVSGLDPIVDSHISETVSALSTMLLIEKK